MNGPTLTVYVSTIGPLLNTQELYIHQTHGRGVEGGFDFKMIIRLCFLDYKRLYESDKHEN